VEKERGEREKRRKKRTACAGIASAGDDVGGVFVGDVVAVGCQFHCVC